MLKGNLPHPKIYDTGESGKSHQTAISQMSQRQQSKLQVTLTPTWGMIMGGRGKDFQAEESPRPAGLSPGSFRI